MIEHNSFSEPQLWEIEEMFSIVFQSLEVERTSSNSQWESESYLDHWLYPHLQNIKIFPM